MKTQDNLETLPNFFANFLKKNATSKETILKDKYLAWISKHYPDKEKALNRCNEAVRNLTSMFWELTVQVGYANGIYHCWAKDVEGNIIDPTIKQFDGPVEYKLIAERFLQKDEIELSTGAIFLNA